MQYDAAVVSYEDLLKVRLRRRSLPALGQDGFHALRCEAAKVVGG